MNNSIFSRRSIIKGAAVALLGSLGAPYLSASIAAQSTGNGRQSPIIGSKNVTGQNGAGSAQKFISPLPLTPEC